MDLKEIKQMAEYVDFQSHTESHPILPMCSGHESFTEISHSKVMLEKILKKEITSIAFPNGDYTNREIEFSRDSGYKFMFTVSSGSNNLNSISDTINRIPLSDKFGRHEVLLKTSGVFQLAKEWMLG